MKNKKWWLLAVVLFICGFAYVGYKEAQTILKQSITAWQVTQKADCAVVFTGGPGRVSEGFDLLAQANIKKLIISGVFPGARLREIFPQWPYYGQLDSRDIILEKSSRTTYGNAQQSLPLIEALNCRDLILITSRLHMHRAHKTLSAVLPSGFPLYLRAIVSNSYRPKVWPLMAEATKSLFYSIWAY